MTYETTGVMAPEESIKQDLGAIHDMSKPGGKGEGGDAGLYAHVVAAFTGSMFLSGVVALLHETSGNKNASPKASTAGHPPVQSKSVFVQDRFSPPAGGQAATPKPSPADIRTQQAIEQRKRSIDAATVDSKGTNRYEKSLSRLDTGNKDTLLAKQVLAGETEVKVPNPAPKLNPKKPVAKSRFAIPTPPGMPNLSAFAGRQ